jgi:hypothetical protein
MLRDAEFRRSIILFQVHSGTEGSEFIGVAVEHQSFARPVSPIVNHTYTTATAQKKGDGPIFPSFIFP